MFQVGLLLKHFSLFKRRVPLLFRRPIRLRDPRSRVRCFGASLGEVLGVRFAWHLLEVLEHFRPNYIVMTSSDYRYYILVSIVRRCQRFILVAMLRQNPIPSVTKAFKSFESPAGVVRVPPVPTAGKRLLEVLGVRSCRARSMGLRWHQVFQDSLKMCQDCRYFEVCKVVIS